jgi:hypothetical protein
MREVEVIRVALPPNKVLQLTPDSLAILDSVAF